MSKEIMLETANNIKKLQYENLEFVEMIGVVKKRCDIKKNEIMSIITEEKDDKDKKKFSNADMRSAEFEKRMINDKDYNNDIAYIKQLEDNISKNNIEIAYNDRLFRYYEIIFK